MRYPLQEWRRAVNEAKGDVPDVGRYELRERFWDVIDSPYNYKWDILEQIVCHQSIRTKRQDFTPSVSFEEMSLLMAPDPDWGMYESLMNLWADH